MRMNVKDSDYIPALKYSWLTRFYDPVVALTTRENVFRQKLLEQADFNAGKRVLDLACGTGTFKMRTLEEVSRVLRPDGVFHVCDWGRPTNLLSKVMFTAVRLLDGFDVTQDNFAGRLSIFIEKAGFGDIRMSGHVKTMLGTMDIMTAHKPTE